MTKDFVSPSNSFNITETKDTPKLSAWQEFDNALLDVEKGALIGALKSCGWLAKKGIQISGAVWTGVLSGIEAIDRWQKGNSAVREWEKETTRQMQREAKQKPGFKTVVLWTPNPFTMQEVREKGKVKGIKLDKLKKFVKNDSSQGQDFVDRTTDRAVSGIETLFDRMKGLKGR